jgi:hypothetical protein
VKQKKTSHFRTENQRTPSQPEDFFYLSLPTKSQTCLDESFAAYFDEERVYGRPEPVFRQYYLLLQLERWEFPFNTGWRIKLVH